MRSGSHRFLSEYLFARYRPYNNHINIRSPMFDFGYDISDFRDIDPTFGTLADFDKLLAKAKTLGLKVILDYVPNHTSHEHEWFQKSVARDPDYDDYYMWHSGFPNPAGGANLPPNNWVSVTLNFHTFLLCQLI